MVVRQRIILFMAHWEYTQYIYLLNSVRAGHYESLLQHVAQCLNTCTSFNIIPGCRIRAICTRYKVILIFLCYLCIPFLQPFKYHQRVQLSSDLLQSNFFKNFFSYLLQLDGWGVQWGHASEIFYGTIGTISVLVGLGGAFWGAIVTDYYPSQSCGFKPTIESAMRW